MTTAASADPITESLSIIRRTWTGQPRVGIVLGTGLGGFVDRMQIEATFERADLPHFPARRQ